MFFLRDLSNGEAVLLIWLDLCQFYSEHQSFTYCKQAAKFLRKSMSGDQTSPNPLLDSTHGYCYPVQFPLRGDLFGGLGMQPGERNNYGSVAQFLDLAIERSPDSFPSAAPIQPFHSAVFPKATRDTRPFSFHTLQVHLCNGLNRQRG